MKKNINDFNEEITSNFSELFIETYFIRYLSEYSKDDLLDNTKKVKELLLKKLNKNLKKKLKQLGYSNKDIKL